MKTKGYRLTSVILALAILLSLSAPVFGADATDEISIEILNCDNGVLEITEEKISGGLILRQYDNGVLSTQVTVENNKPELTVETLDNDENVVRTEIVDVTAITKAAVVEPKMPNGTSMGTLHYSTSNGPEAINAAYMRKVYSSATFTIGRQTMALATMASIIVSALGMTTLAATAAAKWILGIVGITITTGTFVFPGRSLGCEQTDYTYNLEDNNNRSHTNSFMSSTYYITDDTEVGATYKGKTFYEGWSPSTAKQDVVFAQTCFTYMFDNVSYTFTGW